MKDDLTAARICEDGLTVAMHRERLRLEKAISFVKGIFDRNDFPIPVHDHPNVPLPGVYIVLDKQLQTPLYIGEAKNIKRRLQDKRHPIKKRLKYFSFDNYKIMCLVFMNDVDRYRAETILIASLMPVHNRVIYLHGMKAKR